MDGVELEEAACADHADEVELLVGGGGAGILFVEEGFFELVAVDIDKIGEGGTAATDAEQSAGGAVLDADHGLALPIVVEEEPAGEHLFGGEALVGGLPTDLDGEVAGKGLQGADAVVVVDVEVAEGFGYFTGKGLRTLGCPGWGAEKEQKQEGQGAAQQRMAEQSTQLALLLHEKEQHAEEQTEVTGIGHTDAVGVVGHRKEGAETVFIETGLIETVVAETADVVHRNGGPTRLRTLFKELKGADVVHRREGAFVVLQVEFLKGDGKRELGFASLFQLVDVGGLIALTQMDGALTTEEVGGEGSCQNEQKGEVKGKGDAGTLHMRAEQIE